MPGQILPEREFLIEFGIQQFNTQFNTRLERGGCDLKSIAKRYGADYSYEIFTLRGDDHLRIRLHLTTGVTDNIQPFRLEVDGSPDGAGNGSDEVFVTSGTIDNFYRDSGMYKFDSINVDETRLNVLLTEDNQAVLLENGETLDLE